MNLKRQMNNKNSSYSNKYQNSQNGKPSMTPEKYASLKAEAEAPYKGLRKFIYIALGASELMAEN